MDRPNYLTVLSFHYWAGATYLVGIFLNSIAQPVLLQTDIVVALFFLFVPYGLFAVLFIPCLLIYTMAESWGIRDSSHLSFAFGYFGIVAVIVYFGWGIWRAKKWARELAQVTLALDFLMIPFILLLNWQELLSLLTWRKPQMSLAIWFALLLSVSLHFWIAFHLYRDSSLSRAIRRAVDNSRRAT